MSGEERTPVNANETGSFPKTPQYSSSSDFKKLKFMLEETLQRSDPIKLFATLQTSGKKIMEDIEDISKQIYEAKVPFLPYYHPATDTIKSRKEITIEMQNHFDFFKGTTPPNKRSIKTMQKNDVIEGKLVSTPKGFRINKVATPVDRKKYFFKVFDEKNPATMEGNALNASPKEVMTIATTPGNRGLDTAQTEDHPDSRIKTSFARCEPERISLDLNKGENKRKKILGDMRKSRDTKSMNGLHTIFTDAQEQNPLSKGENTRETLYSMQRSRLLKKMDISTKSPYSNAYYNILAMAPNQRHNVVSKLNVSPLPQVQSEQRK